MAAYTNFITPTSINSPPHSKGALRYFTRIFSDTDPDDLTTTVNAFLDGLAVDGEPWPHLVNTQLEIAETQTGPPGLLYNILVTYLLTG